MTPAANRLLQLHYVSQLLRDVYTHEGAEIWLHGRKRSLDRRRPDPILALVRIGRAPTLAAPL